jgi:hypothetical protein
MALPLPLVEPVMTATLSLSNFTVITQQKRVTTSNYLSSSLKDCSVLLVHVCTTDEVSILYCHDILRLLLILLYTKQNVDIPCDIVLLDFT